MSGKITRIGRPSNAEVIRREAQARRSAMNHLIRALQHLNHPSCLSELPLCQLDVVKRQAAMLRGYRYPRAHIVIQPVRQAQDLAWTELGGTEDACGLIALADALEGVSREVSAHKTGVSRTELSRRRREAVDMIIDHVLARLQGERSGSQALRVAAPSDVADRHLVSTPSSPLLAGIAVPRAPSFADLAVWLGCRRS